MQWDRPWALWCLPLFFLAWWLLVRARRPGSIFTGAHAYWPEDSQRQSASQRRSFWPARFWELAAMATGLLALAGPDQRPAQQDRNLRVIVDRTSSMYLPHARGSRVSRLARALNELEGWKQELTVEFVDAGAPLPTGQATWPQAWDSAPESGRSEIMWAAWDQPDALWLTDAVPDWQPLHASFLAVGGEFIAGPVALVPGGVLLDDGHDVLRKQERAPERVVGGAQWPAAWAEFARLWSVDRGLSWAPEVGPGPGVALELMVPTGRGPQESQAFDVSQGGYRLLGRWVPGGQDGAAALSAWSPGPWRSAGHALIYTRSGQVRLDISEGQGVQGDLGAFAVDLARLMDAARKWPSDLVSQAERRALPPGSKRNAALSGRTLDRSRAPSAWAPWLAIASILCLLASFGTGRKRRSVAR